jgi:ATP-dependent Clp endopeptidase proteolytic subunit ClpP
VKENVSTTTDLRELRQELLIEEIRAKRAEAEKAEIELAVARDVERDRLVKTGRIRVLNMFDTIVPPMTDKWIDALEHWGQRDPGEPITININSPGGSVTDGLALYDTIQRLRRKGHIVTTRGMGLVASMAGVLLQAGDERILDKRAKLLIHEGSTSMRRGEQLTAGDMEDMKFFSDMLRGDILDILSERSTLSKRQIENRWKRRDWVLSADEALKFGFVDRVE